MAYWLVTFDGKAGKIGGKKSFFRRERALLTLDSDPTISLETRGVQGDGEFQR